MSIKNARIIGFVLSLSGMAIAGFYLLSDKKEEYKQLVYVGLALLIGSIVMRNLIRFKPDWFKDK